MEFEEQYIMLDFQDKIEQNFFANSNMFFKMANLDTDRPYVQISDQVFSGKYEDGYLGTQMFFEEVEEPTTTSSLYHKKTPINLRFVGKTTKVLSLSWQQVPVEELVDMDKNELKDIVFRDNYEAVLEKIQKGTLNIEDNLCKEKSEGIGIVFKGNTEENKLKKKKLQVVEETIPVEGDEVMHVEENEIPVQPNKYDLLKNSIVHPIRDPEYCQRDVDALHNYNDFMILKQLHLNRLDYSKISLSVSANIENYVDVKASIEDGVIAEKTVEELTENDKVALFELENFANLSVPMQLTILVEHLKIEKKHLENLSEEEKKVKDEYGRTPKKRYRLLKSFIKDLEYYLFVRMKHNKLILK